MPSIGNIVVRRIIQRKLLPPIYEQIVKGPVAALEQSLARLHLILPSLIGAGGESPKPHREVLKFITQSIAVSAGTVNRVKVSGVVGISYTQTSFTFESYTISGQALTKTISQTITITEPLSVQRRKGRTLFEDSPQFTDLSATVSIRRSKTRALLESTIISETLTAKVTTQTIKVLTETNSISESLAKVKQTKRLQVETVSESGDVTLTLPGVKKTLSESVAILENLQGEVTHAGGINITKSLSDTTTLDESITRQLANYRALAQTIALAETVTKLIVTARKSYSSSFTSLSFTAKTRPEKTLTESVGESHTVRMALTKKRSVPTQSVSITEQVSAIVTEARVADIVPITEEVTRIVGRSKPLGDSVTISDTITITRPDVVTISDQVTRVVSRNRSISQSVTIIG